MEGCEKTIISAQVPTPLRDELLRLASQHEHSLSDEIRRGLRLHIRVEDPGGGSPRPASHSEPVERRGSNSVGRPAAAHGEDAA
jgi:hypothetical protein